MIYKECEVLIREVKTLIDLVKLGHMEYDIILRMYWLSSCHAHVDCQEKQEIFKMKGVQNLHLKELKLKRICPLFKS